MARKKEKLVKKVEKMSPRNRFVLQMGVQKACLRSLACFDYWTRLLVLQSEERRQCGAQMCFGAIVVIFMHQLHVIEKFHWAFGEPGGYFSSVLKVRENYSDVS